MCSVYLQSTLQPDRYSWIIYLLKCLKSKEKAQLEASKQQTRSRLTYLDVSKMQKWYSWCFEVQIIASKIDGTFAAVKNEQEDVLGVFTVQTARRSAQRNELQVKMRQKRRNNVFRRKLTTNKAPSKIFRGFEVGKKGSVVFPKLKNKTKG